MLAKKPQVLSEVFSLSSVKYDLDTVLCQYLVHKKYKENTKGSDIKILLGFASILLSLALLFLSLNFSFDSYKYYAAAIVAAYWILAYLESFIFKFFYYYTFIGSNETNLLKVITKLDSPLTKYTILFYFDKKEIPNKVTLDITSIYNKKELNEEMFIELIKEGLMG